MNLDMTPQEIARWYKEAKKKNEAIGILADMNLCRKADIVAVLESEGVTLNGIKKKPIQLEADELLRRGAGAGIPQGIPEKSPEKSPEKETAVQLNDAAGTEQIRLMVNAEAGFAELVVYRGAPDEAVKAAAVAMLKIVRSW